MFRYIRAMSQSLSEIRRSLIDATDQLDHHLIKLILYPSCSAKEHWRAEVYSYLNSVKRTKSTNKFPNYRFIRQALRTDEDILDNYAIQVRAQYKNLRPANIADREIVAIVSAYHDWLAERLSTRGIVTSDEVFDKLEELNL